ncbi:hypothetical protein STAS_06642 [Striga asiatica]|uniref:FLZ-type domain-containing protein n=1 Tax=Striga asiatica TaxID=4170 RepID=A0A5A7PDG1_STRAF|nr:hypothetical protein STAS_06642 [Striga asiatica]
MKNSKSWVNILTIPSSSSRETMHKRGEDFLDTCEWCKKKIGEDKDRYMYGSFQVFCSIECRDRQVAVDDENNPPSPICQDHQFVFKPKASKVRGSNYILVLSCVLFLFSAFIVASAALSKAFGHLCSSALSN